MHIIHALSVPPALYTHTRIHVILRVQRFTVHRHHPMPLLCSIAEISFNIISSSQSSPTTLCFNDNYLKIQTLTAAKATTLTTALMEAVMTAVVTEAAEEMTTGLMTLGVGL